MHNADLYFLLLIIGDGGRFTVLSSRGTEEDSEHQWREWSGRSRELDTATSFQEPGPLGEQEMRPRSRTVLAHSRCHWMSLPRCSVSALPARMGTPRTSSCCSALRQDGSSHPCLLSSLDLQVGPSEEQDGSS